MGVNIVTQDLDLKNRVGKFEVEREVIDDYPEVVMQIMGQVIVLRAEFLLHKNAIEYIARSPHFEEGPEGMEAPSYDIEINEDVITWIRRA
jgi:hypothetical protein